jgi:hypothetical protein
MRPCRRRRIVKFEKVVLRAAGEMIGSRRAKILKEKLLHELLVKYKQVRNA